MVKGMPKLSHIHNDTYKGCPMGKNTKSPFRQSENRSKEKLGLVHYDLCRPMFVASPSIFLYYVISIYDYSRKPWIYLVKSK